MAQGKFRDLVGEKFGRLEVKSRAQNLYGAPAWVCLCECGVLKTISGSALKRGHSTSCGCFRQETGKRGLADQRSREGYIHGAITHGMSTTSLYNIYRGILKRCYDTSCAVYEHYGAKGVTVCERWQESFENFAEDVGERPSNKHSIDRVDGKFGYGPDNFRWATSTEQGRNKGISSRNKTGKTGVMFDKNKNTWVAYYSNPFTGQRNVRKSFSIRKYGDEDAFKMACEWRDARISEINEQGAGYSVGHGT